LQPLIAPAPTSAKAHFSKDLGEKVTNPHRHQNRGDGPLTDILAQLIRGFIGSIYMPLNRIARVRDSSLCSISHTPLRLPLSGLLSYTY
jgi:hypothetical protein